MLRRELLKYGGLASGMIFLPRMALTAESKTVKKIAWNGIDLSWSPDMPPLFITAYIDPTINSQKHQESIVAKYPIALVPQDNRIAFRMWRNKVKKINPDIKLFAYQMVIEETSVPGPGHDVMKKVKNSWVSYLGSEIRVRVDKQFKRVFDPRNLEWQEAFIEACEKTIDSYPYDGLLLDQCTVFDIAAPLPSIKKEMQAALESTLEKLRKRNPSLSIIANTSMQFPMLNGELMENRLSDLESINLEMERTQKKPIINLYQDIVDEPENARSACVAALSKKRFFGVAINYQKAEWPDFLNEITRLYL